MRFFPLSLLISSLLLAAPAAYPQEFWQKKPYTEWTEKECRKLLEDSPWTQQHIVSRTFIQRIGDPSAAPGREQHPRITYTVQLRSAAPVRQAMVRLEQLAKNYDQMNAEQRATFDQQAKRFLTGFNPNVVVVYVEYGSNVAALATDAVQHWQTVLLARAKNEMFLLGGDGQRLEPLQITHRQGGGVFQMAFPRAVEGKAVLTEDNKELKVEFPHPNIGELGAMRVLLTFKVKDLIVNNKLEY